MIILNWNDQEFNVRSNVEFAIPVVFPSLWPSFNIFFRHSVLLPLSGFIPHKHNTITLNYRTVFSPHGHIHRKNKHGSCQNVPYNVFVRLHTRVHNTDVTKRFTEPLIPQCAQIQCTETSKWSSQRLVNKPRESNVMTSHNEVVFDGVLWTDMVTISPKMTT